jgi:hypothetical protein
MSMLLLEVTCVEVPSNQESVASSPQSHVPLDELLLEPETVNWLEKSLNPLLVTVSEDEFPLPKYENDELPEPLPEPLSLSTQAPLTTLPVSVSFSDQSFMLLWLVVPETTPFVSNELVNEPDPELEKLYDAPAVPMLVPLTRVELPLGSSVDLSL